MDLEISQSTQSATPDAPIFLMTTCQVGAEKVLKQEMERLRPEFRAAYSRPGFVTFRMPSIPTSLAEIENDAVFARAVTLSLGKVCAEEESAMVHAVWEKIAGRKVSWIHVWERDAAIAGTRGHIASVCETTPRKKNDEDSENDRNGENVRNGKRKANGANGVTNRNTADGNAGEYEDPADVVREPIRYEPGITLNARRIAEQLVRDCPRSQTLAPACRMNPFLPAALGDTVLDVILVGPREWWVGIHVARTRVGQISGGLLPLTPPKEMVSRAWLKMEEALWWSELPIQPGDECAEIGSAPGGASQAILARGALLYGIDPAAMAPKILHHPHFIHIRKRTHEVRRRVFRNVKWLAADMNVAPDYTLDSVEGIVTHPECGVQGMILTLKLFQWTLVNEIPRFLERIQSWGFCNVRARQLLYNRQEICVTCNGRANP